MRSVRSLAFFVPFAAACGGNIEVQPRVEAGAHETGPVDATSEPPIVDAGSEDEASSQADAATDDAPSTDAPPVNDASGATCTTNADCPAGQGEQCLYLVGDCSATAHCVSLGSLCGIAVLCGGCGPTVAGICSTGPPQYALGPATSCP